MRNAFLLGALFSLGLTAAAARAADPALVAGTEKHLADEEKAILAALLLDARAGAEFDADASAALRDTKVLKLLLDKWRGRIAAFAEADSRRADPDLEGAYRNYAEMLTPEMRAYLGKRAPLLPADERDELIGYLKDINKSLADDGRLSWYTKRVVAGIMDRYRSMLKIYAASPLAQEGKRNGPAATVALAKRHEESALLARAERDRLERERTAAAKPPEPRVAKPQAPPARVASGALGQADNAARGGNAPGRTPEEIASNAGGAFDGGAVAPGSSGGTVAAGPGGGKLPPLPAATPGGTPSLIGAVPAPATPEDDFMSRIESQQTKEPASLARRHLPEVAMTLLLGAAGFVLGGPLGALIGAVVLAALVRG